MSRVSRAIFPLLLLPCLLFADGEASAQDASGDLAAIESFFPRREGGSGEKQLVEFIKIRLASLGIRWTAFDFSESDFQHSFSSNIRVDIPGKRADTVILAVPLNHPASAEMGSDGSIGIAAAIDLLRRYRGDPPPVSLTVLFLGAEFGPSVPDQPKTENRLSMGSTLFLRDFQPAQPVAIVYLDVARAPSRLLLRAGAKGIVSPYWLMQRCIGSLRSTSMPFQLRADESQVFRMGILGERTAIEPYLNAGYPAIGLEGVPGAIGRQDAAEWMRSFGAFFADFLRSNAGGIQEEWDRHYLPLQVGGLTIVITEGTYLAILISAFALMLLYSLVFRKGLKKYLRTLSRNALALVPLAGLTFLFLFVATLALQGLLAIRRFEILWSYAPVAFLALKLCLAVFLYAALYNPLRRLPFPRNGSFYSAAALAFLLIDIFIVAFLNISFAWYFLWAYLFVFLSALVPNRYAKALLFIPAPLWGIRGLIDIFTMPALPFCRFLLLSPVKGNLFLAAVSLPFVLVLLRLGLIFPGRGLLKRGVRERVSAAVLLACALGISGWLLALTPFSPADPQPLLATQTLEAAAENGATASSTNSLTVTSPAPLGALTVGQPGDERRYTLRATSLSVSLPPAEIPLRIASESSRFLGKQNQTLHVSLPGSLMAVAATLTSDEDFILFDCTFPFTRESSREYRLLIGSSPPNPLDLQLTLPTDGSFALTLTMELDSPLIGTRVVSAAGRVTTRVRVVKTVAIRT